MGRSAMEQLTVDLGARSYPILIGDGLIRSIGEHVAQARVGFGACKRRCGIKCPCVDVAHADQFSVVCMLRNRRKMVLCNAAATQKCETDFSIEDGVREMSHQFGSYENSQRTSSIPCHMTTRRAEGYIDMSMRGRLDKSLWSDSPRTGLKKRRLREYRQTAGRAM